MEEAERPEDSGAFARLEQEVKGYAASPSGVGLDVPAWLRRVEMEVHKVRAARTAIALLAEDFFAVPKVAVPFEELQRQIREWEKALGEK